ncbi:hypothetical protein [Mesorhizobium sp. IMUNJ 23232]|uniref:hypothetical protein n=1 Tax=Mesorhizobium sp. IMUNJ 23232 TaxID=3376064 RepID=UPI0037AED8D4
MRSFPSPLETSSISADTLLAAVGTGVLSAEQAQALFDLEGERTVQAAPASRDDEQFRFISGFGDIFVTIGLGLFLGALGYFTIERLGMGGATLVAAASWLLAEYFTRVRRMALPSIVLLLVYASMVFYAAEFLFGPDPDLMAWSLERYSMATIGAGLATALAAVAHYWRFRVPITIAAGVAALVAAVVGILILIAPDFSETGLTAVLFVCGLAVFALAMRFDLSDPRRETRRIDIAFWLHMLAAPLIVHPLINGFVLDSGNGPNEASAWSILAVFALLSIVAVLVDRRAILVSGLTYAGIAFGTLAGGAGLVDSVVPLTMLALGALVLMLSAGWHALRHTLLSFLPDGLARRFPIHT